MLQGKIFTNCICTILLSMTMGFTAGCTSDNEYMPTNKELILEREGNVYSPLYIRIYSDSKDITADGTVEDINLFIFDADGNYLKTIALKKKDILNNTKIEISFSTPQITVIACSETGLESLTKNWITSDIFHSQFNSKIKEEIQSNNINDLFYGETIIKPSSETSPMELKVYRKTSIINLTAKGIIKKYDDISSSFSFKITSQYSDKSLTSIYPAVRDSSGDIINSGEIVTIPSDKMTIELYKNNELVYTLDSLSDISQEGRKSYIMFDITTSTKDVYVTEWDSVLQIVNVS